MIVKPDEIPLIFLAEDDIDDQELLIDAFGQIHTNVKVKAVTNGRKAIDYLCNPENSMPCLIVLDYNLPEVNGSEILQRLSEDTRFSHVPKVVWSTSNSQHYRSMCLDLGAREYFVKPSDINGIEKLAKEMLHYCGLLASNPL